MSQLHTSWFHSVEICFSSHIACRELWIWLDVCCMGCCCQKKPGPPLILLNGILQQPHLRFCHFWHTDLVFNYKGWLCCFYGQFKLIWVRIASFGLMYLKCDVWYWAASDCQPFHLKPHSQSPLKAICLFSCLAESELLYAPLLHTSSCLSKGKRGSSAAYLHTNICRVPAK